MSSEVGHVGGSCVVGHEHSLPGGVLVGVMMIGGRGGWVHGRHVGTIGIPCVGGVVGDSPSTVPSAVKFPVSVCMVVNTFWAEF